MKKLSLILLGLAFTIFGITFAADNELNQAYNFAYKNGITTMDSIDKANMDGSLNRIAMAKMLSNYAMNILGKKPANTVAPKFSDVPEQLNKDYDGAIELAYQLGIMGIGIKEFRPHDGVTRAEFATALSRMLYGIEDGDPYYSTHLAKLKAEGIISNDNPNLQEKRGYVMLMLMRSSNKISSESNKSKSEEKKEENLLVSNNKEMEETNKSLILVFSPTGNTKRIATFIDEITESDLVELIPEVPYTSADLDYNSDCRANKEQNDDTARPGLATDVKLDGYDRIYLGYPIWWGTNPKLILTLVEKYDFSGKEVVLFCTSGSSGIGTSETALKGKGLNVIGAKRFSASSSKEEVKIWLESL